MFAKRFVLCVLGILASLSLIGCGGRSKSTSTTTPPTSIPITVTLTATASTVDPTNSVTLSVVVANDKNAAGVSWAVTGGGALSASTTNGTTYTAPAPTASALTVTVTATSIADTSKSGTSTITVAAGPAITTSSLAAGTVGTSYSATLAGAGGIPPYSWSLAGGSTLPAGLTLNSAGAISGVPLAPGAGTANVTFQVTDSGKATALTTTAALALSINPAAAITFPNPILPVGTRNAAYTGSVAGSGGAGTLTYSIVSGTFPAGLTMAGNGAITGTPTATANALITVKAADAFGDSATDVFSLVVNYVPITITTTSLPDGIAGIIYTSTTLVATGGSGGGYSWAVTSGSTLPAGLSLSSGGVLSGKPTTAGSTSVNMTVTDSVSDKASATLSIIIEDPGLAISTPKHLNAYIGSSYLITMKATGGSGKGYTWALGSGSALPAGFSLSAAGVLSGNPTVADSTNFTVTVTDSASATSSANFMLNVAPGVSITTLPTLPAAIAGGNYYTTLGAIGGSGTGFNWTVSSGSTLPNGLTLLVSGVLRGIPTTAGTYNFSLTVTDSALNTSSSVFALTVTNALAITTPTSLTAFVGVTYTQVLSASGGTGTGYTWTVTSGGSSLTALSLNVTSAGVISGRPSTSGTATFTITLTDSFADTATATFTLTASSPVAPTLPAANPASLPSATVSQIYAGTVNAAGGVPPYAWTVNGTSVAIDGTAVTLSNGLSVTNDGSQTLTVSGTPTAIGTVTFTSKVTDSLNATSGMVTYNVAVNTPGAKVSGQIVLTNNCGGATIPLILVSINATPPQTTTTNSSGKYAFTNIAAGTYTITPSISGPSSVFYPSTLNSVIVSNTDVNQQNFTASLGYIVTGSVGYSGAQTGPVYVSLNPSNCGGGPLGVTISGPGTFTIHGVPPGTYSAQAWMDVQKYGYSNMSDPSGSVPNIPISGSNLSVTPVTMTDPTAYTLGPGPAINAISPADNGVIINFKPLTGTSAGGAELELATSYTVEWSTDSNFASPAPASYVFRAGGANDTGVWLLNNGTAGMTGSFTNGIAYYFRVRGDLANSQSSPTTYSAPVTIGAPTGAYTVSGTVHFTGTATGPLYVGFFDMNTGMAYATKITTPVNAQTYSVQVPSGSNYFFFGEVDQNNDGMMDPGDFNNTRKDNAGTVAISGNAIMDLTLPDVSSKATVTTQHYKQTSQSVSSEGYILNFDVSEANKLPVSVKLVSGPNVLNPVDIGKCSDCGNNKFQYSPGIAGTVPNAGEVYQFDVIYSDGTPETLSAAVTGVLNDFPTALLPTGAGASTVPTFTWSYPANPTNYVYQFYLSDNNGNRIWQIPGNSSKLDGFTNSVPSIIWGTDPTGDSANQPSVPSLTSDTTYYWQVQAQDSYGNSVQTQVDFLP